MNIRVNILQFLPSTTEVVERQCFLHLTVSHSAHMGVWADIPLGRHIPPGQTTPRQNPPRQTCPWANTPWTDTTIGRQPHPPPRRPLQRTVHILLECILVCTKKIIRIRKQNKTKPDTRQGVGALHSGFSVSYWLLLWIELYFHNGSRKRTAEFNMNE